MASLVVKIGADLKALETAMSRSVSLVQDTGKRMQSLGKTISTRVTAPLAALGGIAIRQAGNFEKLRTSMDALNGSAEEGGRNFERLQEFSAQTPFQLQDLAKAQNMLQGFGLSADDAFESLSMIGDIAAISGGSIDGIGIAFGQAAAEGRLMTQDIRQLINQGVPAIKLLADTMGVAESEVLDLASQGEISFEILQESFRNATTGAGMFADGMQRQSRTIFGLFSTLKDNVSIALGELGSSIVDAFSLREAIPALIENIQNITDWFKHLSDESRRNIVILTAAIGTIGPALVAAGVVVSSFGVVLGALTSPIAIVIGAISGIVLTAAYMVKNMTAIGDLLKEEFRSWVLAAQNTKTLIEKAILSIASLAPGVTGQIARATNTALKIDQGVFDENKAQFQSFGEFAKDIAGDLNNIFASITGIDLEGMFTPAKQEAELSRQSIEQSMLGSTVAVQRFSTVATEGLNKVPSAFRQTSKSILDMSDALQSSITSAATSFAESIGQMIASGGDGQGFFSRMIGIVADFAVQFGRIVVGMGVAALQLQNLFSNPIAAIAAGSALIALGSAAKSLISAGPGGSGGGSSANFEPFARDQQGGQVEFRIEYDSLVGVLDNGGRRRGRVG